MFRHKQLAYRGSSSGKFAIDRAQIAMAAETLCSWYGSTLSMVSPAEWWNLLICYSLRGEEHFRLRHHIPKVPVRDTRCSAATVIVTPARVIRPVAYSWILVKQKRSYAHIVASINFLTRTNNAPHGTPAAQLGPISVPPPSPVQLPAPN